MRRHALCRDLRANVQARDRRWGLRTHRRCFVGEDAVAVMLQRGLANSVERA